MTKRKQNTTALKVRYVNNGNGAKIRFTQLNNKKSCTINFDYNFEVLDKAFDLLNHIAGVKSFSNVVDNTQNSYYLINVDFEGSTFINLIEKIKKQ